MLFRRDESTHSHHFENHFYVVCTSSPMCNKSIGLDTPEVGPAWPLNCHTSVHNETFLPSSFLLTCLAAGDFFRRLLPQSEGPHAEVLRQRPAIRPKGQVSGSGHSVPKRHSDRQE